MSKLKNSISRSGPRSGSRAGRRSPAAAPQPRRTSWTWTDCTAPSSTRIPSSKKAALQMKVSRITMDSHPELITSWRMYSGEKLPHFTVKTLLKLEQRRRIEVL